MATIQKTLDSALVELGCRLRTVRETASLTQRQMAARLRISLRTYCHYEAGTREPGASVLALIVRTFNVTANWLLNGDPDLAERSENLKNPSQRALLALAIQHIVLDCLALPALPPTDKIVSAIDTMYSGALLANDQMRKVLQG